jgi:16S rRNA (uracil1498-N3)-methyltransferase
VLVSAMKQSLKAWLPKLHEPVKFRNFIAGGFPGQKFIAYCETGNESALGRLYIPGNNAVILIGPEGDFSKAEVELATASGFIPVSLGASRLRTETAGIVACHTVCLMNGINRMK